MNIALVRPSDETTIGVIQIACAQDIDLSDNTPQPRLRVQIRALARDGTLTGFPLKLSEPESVRTGANGIGIQFAMPVPPGLRCVVLPEGQKPWPIEP
jgi:hypothetical protein